MSLPSVLSQKCDFVLQEKQENYVNKIGKLFLSETEHYEWFSVSQWTKKAEHSKLICCICWGKN